MAAEPRVLDPDPSDPAEILRHLPDHHRAQFLGEYSAAVEEARRPEHYCKLLELLELWRLRAVAYRAPGFVSRQASAGSAAEGDVPIEQLMAGRPR